MASERAISTMVRSLKRNLFRWSCPRCRRRGVLTLSNMMYEPPYVACRVCNHVISCEEITVANQVNAAGW